MSQFPSCPVIRWKELCKKGKEKQIPLKDDDKGKVEELSDMLKAAIKMKENAKTTDAKLHSTAAIEDARTAIKQVQSKSNNLNRMTIYLLTNLLFGIVFQDQGRRFLEKHMFGKGRMPTVASIEGRIESWADNIRKLEVDIRNRDENKEVALGTSKINYMDPRISVAWCKRCEVPIDKVFAKTLRDKFNWAMAVPPDWKFE